jgi:hypothetical protein
LTDGIRQLKPDFDGIGRRLTDSQLLEMADAIDPSTLSNRAERPNFSPEQLQRFLDSRALRVKSLNFLIEEGAAVMVDNSNEGEGGTLFVSGASVAGKIPTSVQDLFGGGGLRAYDKEAESKMIPQMTMASEDYNRLVRMIDFGVKPKIKINIQTKYYDADLMGYNTITEIPGTDPNLKDEIVMVGAHLDSWHASGGATDNGAGSAVAMEAARILLATGLKPRRTIRVGLWSGEEQGLNGSRAYVKQHFGEIKGGGRSATGDSAGTLDKKPDYEKFSAYYNMDNGTGKFRGVYLQGNSAVAPIFRA